MQQNATQENWTGLTFANNWIIIEKLNCAQYRNIYIEATGDTSKKIKNTHYLCHNKSCGIDTYMERTVIQRALASGISCMSKCKNCDGTKNTCHYSTPLRVKKVINTPIRNKNIVDIGQTIGSWKIINIEKSLNTTDHQCKAICECLICGHQKSIRIDHLIELDTACECARHHSMGEHLIKQCLEINNISYTTEYTFKDLVGQNGGLLRYDFALYNSNHNLIGLIEFDGQQHFQNSGTYYNPTGLVQIHDIKKNEYAKQNHIPLLRIKYDQKDQINDLIIDFYKKL